MQRSIRISLSLTGAAALALANPSIQPASALCCGRLASINNTHRVVSYYTRTYSDVIADMDLDPDPDSLSQVEEALISAGSVKAAYQLPLTV